LSAKKVIWITGASSGIGLACARALAGAGHHVVMSARGEAALNQACATVRGKTRSASAVAMDVTDQKAVAAAAAKIELEHGRIDVLVANAGANVGVRAWGEVSVADFDQLIRVNLSSVYYCIDAVLPGMRKRKDGLIVNIASWAGKNFSDKPGPGYTSSKAAVLALTSSLNWSQYKFGIRACAISPAETATPAMARRTPPVPKAIQERMLQPEDVADAVRFVVGMPARACINEIVLSPTWNGFYGAPALKPD
jgi:NADP-dependent 3-hydroxy acid dehydrogenase YdfG